MSHKRPSKRSINITDDTTSDYSPSLKSVSAKRSRIEESSGSFQNKDTRESSVRRSSRAPKPKVFDDEYIETSVRSPGSEREIPKKKDLKPVSRNPVERKSIDDDVLVVDDQDTSTKRRSSRLPKPKIFDEDYVETTKMKGVGDKNGRSMSHATDMKISQDAQRDISQKSKIQSKGRHVNKNLVDPVESDLHVASGAKKTLAGAQRAKRKGSTGKQDKEKPNAKDAGGLQEASPMGNEGLEAWGSPKVRTSSRTPVPKKMFSLIDDSRVPKAGEDFFGEGNSYDDVIPQGSRLSKPDKKNSLVQCDSSPTSGKEIDIIYASPVISKKKGTSKLQQSSLDGERNKKSKKSKAGLDSPTIPKNIAIAATSNKLDANKLENISKEKSTKSSSKAVKKISDKVDTKKVNIKSKSIVSSKSVDVVEVLAVKNKGKKKKVEDDDGVMLQQSSNVTKSMPGLQVDKSSSGEHGGRSSKHSKLKHKDKPHSEVKDEDHHIILKVHLPHAEGSHHSHSSHKKHKHKHSSENKSEPSGESKAKKPKLLVGSESSSSEDKHKKKLSIKFKGLSSSSPGIEFKEAEQPLAKGKGKKVKDVESVGKKYNKLSDEKTTVAAVSGEKEHVKVVIKKTKKEIKVITDEGVKSPKKITSKDVKEKTKEDKESKGETSTSIKTTPKKKSKVGESPKSADKEKRKIVSGYLLFCKKERSWISEANPGLEFAQLSQKVGEAWKSLPESVRQKWKAKANDVRKNFILQQEERKTESMKSGPDAVDMAAYLKLLGESLSVIGVSLMAQRETEVHGSLSVLLDSILCAVCPLTFLTSHIPGIPGIPKEKQLQILDDLAYTMPGLG